MEKFHFGDRIEIEGRVYYLQTQGACDTGRIVSMLFDQGQVVERREWTLSPRNDAASFGTEIARFHRERLQALALIAQMIPKVRSMKHPPSLYRLGRLLFSWRLNPLAKEILDMVSVSSSWFVPSRIILAELELEGREGRTQEAIHRLRETLSEHPHPDLWLALAWYLDREGKGREAGEALGRALTTRPEYARAHLLWAILSLKASDPNLDRREEAGKALERAVSLTGAYRRKEVAEAFRTLSRGEIREALLLLEGVYERERVVLFPEGDLFFLDFLYGDAAKDEERLRWHEARIRKALGDRPEFLPGRADWGAVHLVLSRRHLGNACQAFVEGRESQGEEGLSTIRTEALHQMQTEMTEWIRRFFKQGG